MAGESSPDPEHISRVESMVLSGLFALSIYNSIEVYIFIFCTFYRPRPRGYGSARRGLYFWSLIAADTGIWVHSVAAVLRYYQVAPSAPMSVVVVSGWWLMVSGQSLVLYSRLHLVVGDPRKMRWVLCMIAFIFVTLQMPTSALFIFNNFTHGRVARAAAAFDGFEKTQLTAFAISESVISGLYVFEATNALKPMEVTKGTRVRAMLRELVALFAIVLLLDVSLVVLEYAGRFQIQTTYKPVVYSIKLKVEAVVLHRLVRLVQSPTCACSIGADFSSDQRQLQFVDAEDSWWSQHNASMGIPESPIGGGSSSRMASGQRGWSRHLSWGMMQPGIRMHSLRKVMDS